MVEVAQQVRHLIGRFRQTVRANTAPEPVAAAQDPRPRIIRPDAVSPVATHPELPKPAVDTSFSDHFAQERLRFLKQHMHVPEATHSERRGRQVTPAMEAIPSPLIRTRQRAGGQQQ